MHLLRERGLSVDALDHALNYESGLAGVSGLGADLAAIEREAARGNERARLAFEMFADRVRAAIGSLAVTLGGLDALGFTDRIGENSPALRAAVCEGLECLGVRLDAERNRQCPLPTTRHFDARLRRPPVGHPHPGRGHHRPRDRPLGRKPGDPTLAGRADVRPWPVVDAGGRGH